MSNDELNSSARLKFFFPDARVLDDSEVAELPSEKLQSAHAAGKKGVWLEINCPDEKCLTSDGQITIPAAGPETVQKKGFFVKLFCPEDSCELTQMTDLP